LSSDDEIREVYEDDIMRKTLSVYRRKGLTLFYRDGDISVHSLWEGIVDEEDLELLNILGEG